MAGKKWYLAFNANRRTVPTRRITPSDASFAPIVPGITPFVVAFISLDRIENMSGELTIPQVLNMIKETNEFYTKEQDPVKKESHRKLLEDLTKHLEELQFVSRFPPPPTTPIFSPPSNLPILPSPGTHEVIIRDVDTAKGTVGKIPLNPTDSLPTILQNILLNLDIFMHFTLDRRHEIYVHIFHYLMKIFWDTLYQKLGELVNKSTKSLFDTELRCTGGLVFELTHELEGDWNVYEKGHTAENAIIMITNIKKHVERIQTVLTTDPRCKHPLFLKSLKQQFVTWANDVIITKVWNGGARKSGKSRKRRIVRRKSRRTLRKL